MNHKHLGWDKVKVGDRVKYHSPVQGNHTGIVVQVYRRTSFGHVREVKVQPVTTSAALRGEVIHDLMTVNHSLWSIY